MRERRAYVILVLISAMLSAISIGFSVRMISESQHKFCDVIAIVITHPPPKPADPHLDPTAERNYKLYQQYKDRYVALSNSLGCS